MILRKQQKKFKLRFRAFKRKPFLFLRHFLLIIIFRFSVSLFVCFSQSYLYHSALLQSLD
mgnify:CR=1 FL=1